MKEILIVTARFNPLVTANTNCTTRLIEELIRQNYKVSVLTFSYSPKWPATEEIDGCTVYRIPVWEDERIDAWLARPSGRILQFFKVHIAALGFKIMGKIRRIRAVRFYKKVLQSKGFSTIFSIVLPMDAHFIASRLPKKTAKWVMFNLDPYIYTTTTGFSRTYRKCIERLWCKKADGWIRMDCHKSADIRGKDSANGLLNVLYSHLPNLTIPETVPDWKEKTAPDKIILRYAGKLYEDIRRPDELLRFLDTLDPNVFSAEFYGQSCDYIRAHFLRIPACVALKGNVGEKVCRQLTETADILLNIGNVSVDQIPSKVFEYIATGKPIINFLNTEDDPSLLYLNLYPRLLTARKAEDISADDVLRLYKQGIVPSDEIRKLYAEYLSENVMQKIINYIEEL